MFRPAEALCLCAALVINRSGLPLRGSVGGRYRRTPLPGGQQVALNSRATEVLNKFMCRAHFACDGSTQRLHVYSISLFGSISKEMVDWKIKPLREKWAL